MNPYKNQALDGCVIQNGTIYNNIEFVNAPIGAMEVLYDRIKLSEDKRSWFYFRHNYLVAIKEVIVEV